MAYRGIFRKRGDAVRLSARLKKKIVRVSNKKNKCTTNSRRPKGVHFKAHRKLQLVSYKLN